MICGVFYILNVLALQINQKQDEDLLRKVYAYYSHYMRINESVSQNLRTSILPDDFTKLSTLSLSMCKLLDHLPYFVLIENGKEILVYNGKMLDFLSISAHEQSVEIKIEAKLNLIKISTGKFHQIFYQNNIFIEDSKKVHRLNRAVQKLGILKNSSKSMNHQSSGGPREEVKSNNYDNIGVSNEYGSDVSVSESENEQNEGTPIEGSLVDALFWKTKKNNRSK
jgi:hypothetical protein